MMNMKKILCVITLLSVINVFRCVAVPSAELDDLISESSLWKNVPGEIMKSYKALGFQFVDGKKIAKSNHAELKFRGFKVWEARIYFESDALSSVELSVYNKGDAGNLSKAEFGKMMEALVANLTELTGSRGRTGKVSNDRANYYINRRLWQMDEIGIRLEWAFVNAHRSGRSMQPFRAEFVKVVLGRKKKSAISGLKKDRPDWARLISGRTLKVNLKQNSAGDIWVDNIPMVDQGQKGYCAAASAERVLRYYGWQGDQHEIAQLADTAAKGGTSLEGMIDALAVVGKRYHLNDKELLKTSRSRSFERGAFYNMIKLYNREAKSKKAAEIDYKNFCNMQGNTRVINSIRIYEAMDPTILKDSKVSQRQSYAKFQQNISNYVKQGVPLFWACFVGKYPETPDLGKNGAFGHVRLIIGINQKTEELIYSDSWGPRHALKRMPLSNAWAMTFGLTVLKPRDVR